MPDHAQGGDDDANQRRPRRRIIRKWISEGVKPAEWVMILFTAVTASAAIAGVFIAQGQLRAMKDQLAEMHSGGVDTHNLVVATQNLANAGREQASAASAQVISIGKTADAANVTSRATVGLAGSAKAQAVALNNQLNELKADQRPYLAFTGPIYRILDIIPEQAGQTSADHRIMLFPAPNLQSREKVVDIHIGIQNTGNSQTERLEILWGCVSANPNNWNDDPFTVLKWDEKSAIRAVIAPKQSIEVAGCRLKASDVLDSQSGLIRRFIVGEIRYGDRTTGDRPYVTQFAQQLEITNGADDIDKFFSTSHAVGAHNCTDSGCEVK